MKRKNVEEKMKKKNLENTKILHCPKIEPGSHVCKPKALLHTATLTSTLGIQFSHPHRLKKMKNVAGKEEETGKRENN